jgi:hypothetical protein
VCEAAQTRWSFPILVEPQKGSGFLSIVLLTGKPVPTFPEAL